MVNLNKLDECYWSLKKAIQTDKVYCYENGKQFEISKILSLNIENNSIEFISTEGSARWCKIKDLQTHSSMLQFIKSMTKQNLKDNIEYYKIKLEEYGDKLNRAEEKLKELDK